MSTDVIEQLNVAQNLPPDLMLLKMENESIMAVARTVPRDPMKIVNQLRELIEAYPAAADEAIYSKPVGTVTALTCADCGVKYEVASVDKDTCCPACESQKKKDMHPVKKYAEGLSIRAAESIRSIFGYTRLATTVQMLPDGSAKITGVLVDYAAGNLTSDERIVSPMYKSRSGQMVRMAEDRFLNVAVKAEKAKLRRDVILDSVPNIVKAMFRDECEKRMQDLVSPELIEQKIIPAFAEFGITEDHLNKIVGRPKGVGWKEQDRMMLKKLLTALKNEETTVREVLADLESLPTTKTNGNGNAQASDLASPKKSGESTTPTGKEPETKQPETKQTNGGKRETPTTHMVGDPPTPEKERQILFDRYLSELHDTKTAVMARAVYDKWWGPDGPSSEWTPDDNAAAAQSRDKHIGGLKEQPVEDKTRSKQKKELFENKPQSAQEAGH